MNWKGAGWVPFSIPPPIHPTIPSIHRASAFVPVYGVFFAGNPCMHIKCLGHMAYIVPTA